MKRPFLTVSGGFLAVFIAAIAALPLVGNHYESKIQEASPIVPVSLEDTGEAGLVLPALLHKPRLPCGEGEISFQGVCLEVAKFHELRTAELEALKDTGRARTVAIELVAERKTLIIQGARVGEMLETVEHSDQQLSEILLFVDSSGDVQLTPEEKLSLQKEWLLIEEAEHQAIEQLQPHYPMPRSALSPGR
jgi:hypothetical protein